MIFKNIAAVIYSLSPVFISMFLLAGTTFATVSVTLEDQFLIPDSIYSEDFTIVDLDNDGKIELLFESNEFIARYSLAQQTTLDYFLKPASSEPRKFSYGFIDEDSNLDYMEVIIITRNYPDSNSLMVVPYLSGGLWQEGDSTELFRFPTWYWVNIWGVPYSQWMSPWMLRDQFLMADEGDNLRLWGEVYLEYSVIDDWYFPTREWGTYTYSITYSFFPGDPSADVGVSIPPWQGDQYTLPGDPLITSILFGWVNSWTSYFTLCYGTTRTAYYFAKIYRGLEPVDTHYPVNLASCPYPSVNQNFCGANNQLKLDQYVVCNAMSGSPGYELVAVESHHGYNADGCSNQEYHLRCFDLSNVDAMPVVWDYMLPQAEQDIDFLFFEPDFPDQFLSFAHDKFLLRDATSGALMDSSAAIAEDAGEMISYQSLETGGSNYAMLLNNNVLSLYILDVSTDAPDSPQGQSLPTSFALHQPYPNPFNSELTIPVSLDRAGHLSVRIYNLLGQKVTDVYNGPASAGELTISWNGRSDIGEEVSSGIYLIRAVTRTGSAIVKCVLLK